MVNLDRDYALGSLQQLHGEVPCARANFQHDIGAFDAGLVYDRLHHQRVLQYVLPLALVKLDACVTAAARTSVPEVRGYCRLGRRGGGGGARATGLIRRLRGVWQSFWRRRRRPEGHCLQPS